MADNLTINQSPIYKFWSTNIYLQRLVRRCLSQFDLTYVEFVIMTVLVLDMADMQGIRQRALRQPEITELLRLNKKITAQTMQSLHQKHLVSRYEDMFDKRSFIVRPTNQGVYILNEAYKAVSKLDKLVGNG